MEQTHEAPWWRVVTNPLLYVAILGSGFAILAIDPSAIRPVFVMGMVAAGFGLVAVLRVRRSAAVTADGPGQALRRAGPSQAIAVAIGAIIGLGATVALGLPGVAIGMAVTAVLSVVIPRLDVAVVHADLEPADAVRMAIALAVVVGSALAFVAWTMSLVTP